ncbi:MAG: glycoside hydrolase domain-containing protein [Ferruginibacter sp.]
MQTAAEVKALLAKNKNADYLLFPEDRMHPIIMQSDIPQRWIQKSNNKTLTDTAARGENFTFQIGVFTLNDLKEVKINFSDFAFGTNKISKNNITCFKRRRN